jgi:hypothetical protein
LFVECTGAAHSQALSATFPEGRGRSSAGIMAFERACEAGSEQVRQHLAAPGAAAAPNQRPFLYALDIHDLQVNHGFEPAPVEDEAAAPTTPMALRHQTQSGDGIQFGDHARVGGDVFTGGKRVVNTGGGSYYAGPIDVGGDFVGGDKHVTQTAGGDIVGRDKIVNERQGDINVGNVSGTGIAIGHGAQASGTSGLSAAEWAQVYHRIEARPFADPLDKEDVVAHVKNIEQEAAKGDQAEAPRLERWLKKVGQLAPDILDVTLAALSGPQAAASAVIRNVIRKAREGSASGGG